MFSHGLLARLAALAPFAGVFAHGMGQAIVIATLPPLGREIGLQEVMIGGIISASSLVFFISSRIWGRISDHWGRKRVMLIGLWGYTAGTLVFATWFAVGMQGWLYGTLLYALIIGTRMGQSAVMSATAPATAAWVADNTTQQTRAAGMGRLSAASNIGSIFGPAIAGLLAAISLLLPLLFAALATALASLLIHRMLRDKPHSPQQNPRERKDALRLFDRRYLPYLALGIAVFAGFSVVQQTLAFRIQDTLHLDSRETARVFGYTMMVSATASLFAQVVLVQRLGLTPMMLMRCGLPLLLMAFLILVWASSLPAFAVAMAMMGLGMGLFGPGFTSATSLAVDASEQGAAAGITTAIPAFGFILGPVIGSGLYQLNPHYPYILTTLLVLPATILAWRVRQYTHPG